MNVIIDKLCQGGTWWGKAPKGILEAYETILGVTFPEDYRYFFLTYGSGSKKGVEIAGYHPSLIADFNIIGKTIYELREYYYYSSDYLFISDTGDGGQICFDKKSWEVFEVYPEPPTGLRTNRIALNFLEFLQKYIGDP